MPLITDPVHAREIYQEARERRVALANICPEHHRGIEAALLGLHHFGLRIGVPDLPIILSFTANYPGRPQLQLMTACRDALFGFDIMVGDLRTYLSKSGPFHALRVMVHLDHGMPQADAPLLEHRLEHLTSVMFDASEYPFDENIRLTAAYVENVRGKVLVEGAVDEIAEASSGKMKNEPTTVEQAVRFMRETGVDLIVANLGTEHRAAESEIRYRGDRAREITAALGRVVVLHGTSSLRTDELASLKDDGIIKVNVWTHFERIGALAIVEHILHDLPNILSDSEIRQLQCEGLLGQKYSDANRLAAGTSTKPGPKLSHFAENTRREAWVNAVAGEVERYLDFFGYERFAR